MFVELVVQLANVGKILNGFASSLSPASAGPIVNPAFPKLNEGSMSTPNLDVLIGLFESEKSFKTGH